MANLHIACRTPESVQFVTGPTDYKEIASHNVAATNIEFSSDTSLYATTDASGITLYSTKTRKQTLHIPCENILATSLSPNSKYITSFQRPSKDAQGNAQRNLKVWDASYGTELLALHQKTFSQDNWPLIQFSSDDALFVHQVTNTLHIYKSSDVASGPILKFPVKGISGFSLSPISTENGKNIVAVYVGESKGSPGFIALHELKETKDDAPTPLARRSFFRANSVRFFWNSTGSAVLALTTADVDATNQSYYGEQKLYFFTADGSSEMAVPLAKDGPVHDVQWSPRGDCFIALAGFMPAKATLFTSACVPKFDLGSGPYNLVRWNPFGRFLVLAGFGNLPGDLAFFDKKADLKCKPMGSTRADNGVTLEWSPCGRYVLAATVAPRLRVDNGYQVFKYDGTLIGKEKKDVLFSAAWQPVAHGTFEDRPQSPRANGQSAAPVAAAVQQPPKPTGYVPPHLRNNPQAAAAAAAKARAAFSLSRDPNEKIGKIGAVETAARSQVGGDLPPGAAPPMSKSAQKNAKRRAAAKKKADEGVTNGVAGMTL